MYPVATARGSVTKHSVVRFADSIENMDCDSTDESLGYYHTSAPRTNSFLLNRGPLSRELPGEIVITNQLSIIEGRHQGNLSIP